jgi:serine O-acetyltransferase
MSPERLWRISAALWRRGLRRSALFVKKVNSAIYHNSLSPATQFSPDIRFGHHGFGTMIHSNVVIGRRVKIWHNVTIAVRAATRAPHRIVIEDDVKIGANAVIITADRSSLCVGRGARIGAGAVVTKDVPAGATVVSASARVIMRGDDGERLDAPADGSGADGEAAMTSAEAVESVADVFGAFDGES